MLSTQPFDFNMYVPVILKVLEIDFNLQRLHAKLVPKIKGGEEAFWRNYYLRILYLRACVGIDTIESDSQLLTLEGSELAACEERVRVTKLIAKIPTSDVLFIDKVQVQQIPTSTNTSTNTNLKPYTSTNTGPSDNTDVGVGASNNKDLLAPDTNAPPMEGELDVSTNTSTKEVPVLYAANRSDKELEDEIEAELNETDMTNADGSDKSLSVASAGASTKESLPVEDLDLDLELDDLELELELELEGLDGAYDELDELEDMILDEIEDTSEQHSPADADADSSGNDKPRSLESSGVLVDGDGTSISSGSLV